MVKRKKFRVMLNQFSGFTELFPDDNDFNGNE